MILFSYNWKEISEKFFFSFTMINIRVNHIFHW
jgi:hypothetical protein